MDYKKIKKSSSLTGIVISLLLVIGIFTGLFLMLSTSMEDSGKVMDPKYNDTYGKLNDARDSLDAQVTEIKTSVGGITEADNSVQAAWNGLKTLGSTLILPIKIIDSMKVTYEAVSINLTFIPTWVKSLVVIGLIAFGIFTILAILSGGSNRI